MRATTSLSVMPRLSTGTAPVDKVLPRRRICAHILSRQPSRRSSIFCPDPLLLRSPTRYPCHWRVALLIGWFKPDDVDCWKVGGICCCPRYCRQRRREEG